MKQKLEIPKRLRKEMLTLQEIGLQDYEINYLMQLKQKQSAGKKWR